jgi:hypothetical protein
MTSDVETNLISVERLKEYGEVAQVRDRHFNFRTTLCELTNIPFSVILVGGSVGDSGA